MSIFGAGNELQLESGRLGDPRPCWLKPSPAAESARHGGLRPLRLERLSPAGHIAYTFLKKFWLWARIRSLDGIAWRSCYCYFYKNRLYIVMITRFYIAMIIIVVVITIMIVIIIIIIYHYSFDLVRSTLSLKSD